MNSLSVTSYIRTGCLNEHTGGYWQGVATWRGGGTEMDWGRGGRGVGVAKLRPLPSPLITKLIRARGAAGGGVDPRGHLSRQSIAGLSFNRELHVSRGSDS